MSFFLYPQSAIPSRSVRQDIWLPRSTRTDLNPRTTLSVCRRPRGPSLDKPGPCLNRVSQPPQLFARLEAESQRNATLRKLWALRFGHVVSDVSASFFMFEVEQTDVSSLKNEDARWPRPEQRESWRDASWRRRLGSSLKPNRS